MNGLAAILFASFVITKIGACNYKETMYWKFAAFFLGSFVILCSIEAAGYRVFKQQTDFPEKHPVSSELVTPAPMPFSIPVPQNEIPQLISTKVIGYAEQRQKMNEEAERQRKERDKHYALSDELKQKIYITSADRSIADTTDRGRVTYKPIKPDKNEYNQQRQIAEGRMRYEQSERIPERNLMEDIPDKRQHHALHDANKRLCGEMKRYIFYSHKNEVFNTPIGTLKILKGPKGNITYNT